MICGTCRLAREWCSPENPSFGAFSMRLFKSILTVSTFFLQQSHTERTGHEINRPGLDIARMTGLLPQCHVLLICSNWHCDALHRYFNAHSDFSKYFVVFRHRNKSKNHSPRHEARAILATRASQGNISISRGGRAPLSTRHSFGTLAQKCRVWYEGRLLTWRNFAIEKQTLINPYILQLKN